MNKLFTPSSREVRVLAVIYCIFGLTLLVFNLDILSIILRVLGFITLSLGLGMMYMYIAKIRDLTRSSMYIGFPSAVMGLLVLMSPGSVLSIFPALIAILLIIHSLFHTEMSFRLKKKGLKNWLYLLGAGILILLLGILILSNLIKDTSIVLKLIGIGLIVQAILLFIDDGVSRAYTQ